MQDAKVACGVPDNAAPQAVQKLDQVGEDLLSHLETAAMINHLHDQARAQRYETIGYKRVRLWTDSLGHKMLEIADIHETGPRATNSGRFIENYRGNWRQFNQGHTLDGDAMQALRGNTKSLATCTLPPGGRPDINRWTMYSFDNIRDPIVNAVI